MTPDAFADPGDLDLECTVHGHGMQKSRTSRLMFSAGYPVSYLSAITAPLPGDVIVTGIPAGVGMARTPRRYLRPGDQVVSRIQGTGTIRQDVVAAS